MRILLRKNKIDEVEMTALIKKEIALEPAH